MKEIQRQLKMRQWGEVIRLEVEEGIDRASAEDPEKGTGCSGRGYLSDSAVRWI